MIIAQISDTHIELDNPEGEARIRDLERCVDDINRLDQPPDVVIHTGDVAQNGRPEEYREVKRILGALKCPFHVAAGNRDDRAALRAAFPEADALLPETPFVQFRVTGYPVRLIAIDTLSENSNQGDFCAVRADNLRAVLADGADMPTAIFMHHPPFDIHESKYPFQFETRESVARMSGALDGHGHVVRAFCGHSHRDVSGVIGGVPISSMPSVAVDKRLGDFPDTMRSSPVYRIHRYDADSGFISETRPCPEMIAG